jgi:hypothetical protein
VALSSLVVWICESLMFAFLLPAFGLKLALAPAILAMSVTNLGILLPSSPGFIGSFHFFCSRALIALSVPAATAVAFAVVAHLTFFVPVTLWGAGAILWYGVNLGAAVTQVRAARSSPPRDSMKGIALQVIGRLEAVPPPRKPSAFEVTLAESLIASPPGAVDPKTLLEVATFLAEQTDSLPPRLRLLYRAGMTTFRFYALLRHVQPFSTLDLQRRRTIVESWAFGRVGLLRQLFRPPLSTALLAYYERHGFTRTLVSAPAVGALVAEAHG